MTSATYFIRNPFEPHFKFLGFVVILTLSDMAPRLSASSHVNAKLLDFWNALGPTCGFVQVDQLGQIPVVGPTQVSENFGFAPRF